MLNRKEWSRLRKAAPYTEIRGGKLNRALCWPARVLICVLAVLMFLAMSNPAQTATLGRATLAQLAMTSKAKDTTVYEYKAAGLNELKTVHASMTELVDALENAAALLDSQSKDLAAAVSEKNLPKGRLSTESAIESMATVQQALDSTLGAEVAACEKILARLEELSAQMMAYEPIEAAMQPVQEALAALQAAPEDETAIFNLQNAAMDLSNALFDVGMMTPALTATTDAANLALNDALWYTPSKEEDPTWLEKMTEALPQVDAAINDGKAPVIEEYEGLAAKQEQAQRLIDANGAALAEVEAAVVATQAALEESKAAVKAAENAAKKLNDPRVTADAEKLATAKAEAEAATNAANEKLLAADEALRTCAAALRKAEEPSNIAGTELEPEQSGKLITSARLIMLFVAVGLVGAVMSLGNNKMRKLGLPLLAAGAAAVALTLPGIIRVHESIARNVETLRAAHKLAPMSAELEATVATLAQDIPDALWVYMTIAVATAVFALAAWLTLPRKVEQFMQMDTLTIFQRATRILVAVTGILVFIPNLNPGRISELINENTSLFTVATSRGTITEKLGTAISNGVISNGTITTLMLGSAVVMIGILLNTAGACASLGNNRMKKKVGYILPMAGSAAILAGLLLIFNVHNTFMQRAHASAQDYELLKPMVPGGLTFWAVSAVLVFICSFVSWYLLPEELEEKMEMEEKYRNFLMFLPVLVLTLIFCYMPIWGWRFAFFDYKIGDKLLLYDTVVDGVVTEKSTYVGLKWFTYLFENAATRDDLVRVLRNTLIMSGLGIATSWLPIAFAVLLAEVRSSKFQRLVQTLTTIPNFISWVLVYAIAFAIFSADGFVNSFLENVCGVIGADTDYLASADWIWIKMLLWGTWKGLGWSAIVYIAGIAGIDQQLYEAARVDGANRFQCIRHITIPGLMPTYMVMLLMSVAGMLSNGMDQYLVFENAINKDVIEVLDLYVYNIGIGNGLIPLSTVVGVFKSLIGVTLLFGANRISKAVRGESII